MGRSPGRGKTPLAGVRSPPLHGGQAWVRGLGGETRDGAKGGFLGGARSPRPRRQALLMPRHFITRDGWQKARGLTDTCLGQAQAFFNGRAEPAPPLGGKAELRALAVKGPRSGEGRLSRRGALCASGLQGLAAEGTENDSQTDFLGGMPPVHPHRESVSPYPTWASNYSPHQI